MVTSGNKDKIINERRHLNRYRKNVIWRCCSLLRAAQSKEYKQANTHNIVKLECKLVNNNKKKNFHSEKNR